ncbi:sodium: proton antiporter [Aurantiacibacter atlanticus]|uniref:Sodium: proton antiporter n=1 Tax=Aurantiacibacter atlanticus TaxID=1648404 RepID=A0A0H4V9I2_9SPHN|nr:sodium:proton antiporter [Aurantiacibacter atlanticus]AKQ41170.1 sodium: proton antiporter [Aurantiacibacter atlanticus]MDF1834952.1 sodium:proton antiporter [Alteraurantiacibacter sp. bin_em_oilr2.035]
MEQQALTIALVGVLGIGAQWLAWRTGWPAIVLMLAAGFLAGPVLGHFGYPILDPEAAFGDLLEPMVGIGVALILFEGGLSLDFREFRKYGEGVWRLVLLGVPIGWLLGSLASYYIAGLVWPVAILFAGILVVTGPTVVLPLLRQSSVQQRPAALLRWESIVNDPIGALCAVIAYEYFRATVDGGTAFDVVPQIAFAAIVSGVIGYAAAKFVAWSFPRGLVPEFLKVPVLLVAVVGTFVLCNMIEHEAGLVAVTVMGVALANMHVSSLRSIHPFKQNIAVLLVSGIFILLSASLDISELQYLNPMEGEGLRLYLFLFALLFMVRPATILLSLLGSSVPWNERLFLAWIAPRGIVLVAISGLFALRLSDLGYADGSILIGLSFAVVVSTIVAHGFTVDIVARLLKVKGASRPGLLIAGATPWTTALAETLHKIDTPVMLVDSSWQRLKSARAKGLPTYHGEILNEAIEYSLDLTPFQSLVAATDNEAYNALVCSEFAPEMGTDKVYQLGEGADDEDHRALPASLRGRALFASGYGVDDVQQRQQEGWVFRRTKLSEQFDIEDARETLPEAANMLMLIRPDGEMRFFTHAAAPEPRPGDQIISFAPPRATSEEKAARNAEKNASRRPPKGATDPDPEPA